MTGFTSKVYRLRFVLFLDKRRSKNGDFQKQTKFTNSVQNAIHNTTGKRMNMLGKKARQIVFVAFGHSLHRLSSICWPKSGKFQQFGR